MRNLLLGILPIQSHIIDLDTISFSKSLTRYIHHSLNKLLPLNTYIIKVFDQYGKPLKEEDYLLYDFKTLVGFYKTLDLGFIIYSKVKSYKDRYLVEPEIYSKEENLFTPLQTTIFTKNRFEYSYKILIDNIINFIKTVKKTEDYPIPSWKQFSMLKDIIIDDSVFFLNINSKIFIENLTKNYLITKNVFYLNYILEKLVEIKDQFFITKILKKIENIDVSYQSNILIITFLLKMERLKDLKKYIENFPENEKKFYLYWQIKGEYYLKIKNYNFAKKSILKALSYNPFNVKNYELLFEIFIKSDSIHNLEIFIEIMPKFIFSLLESSFYGKKWLAIYYYKNKDFMKSKKYFNSIINSSDQESNIYYLKTLLSLDKYEEIYKFSSIEMITKDQIIDLIKGNNNFNTKIFFYCFNYYWKNKNSKIVYINDISEDNSDLNLNINDINSLHNWDESFLLLEVVKTIFNDIEIFDEKKRFFKALFYILLKDYEQSIKLLSKDIKNTKLANKFIGLIISIIYDLPISLKYLNQYYKNNRYSYDAIKILVKYHYFNNNRYRFRKYLKILNHQWKDSIYAIFFTLNKIIKNRDFKNAIKILENNKNKFDIESYVKIKLEILYNMKDYDPMLYLLSKYDNIIWKDGKLSYYFGDIFSNIYKDKKGILYYQQSYNLSPSENTKKDLNKTYQKFGFITSKKHGNKKFLKNIFFYGDKL